MAQPIPPDLVAMGMPNSYSNNIPLFIFKGEGQREMPSQVLRKEIKF